jgi:predicted component of viral defense system (DUF524 family)
MNRVDKAKLSFLLDDGQVVGNLQIFSRYPSMVVVLDPLDAAEQNAPAVQLFEEQVYEFEYKSVIAGSALRVVSPLVPSKVSGHGRQQGTIETGSFVGTIQLEVEGSQGQLLSRQHLEARSSKIDYLTDFRTMLDDIARQSIDLLLSHRSTFMASLTTDSFESNVSPQQRLFFIRSIISEPAFKRALNQVVRFPHNRLEAKSESMRFSRTAAPGRTLLIQMLTRPNRIPIPDGHPLKQSVASIPREIQGTRKYETFDTSENRFVKHALNVFERSCKQIENALLLQKRVDNSLLLKDLFDIKAFLHQSLDEDLFKDVGTLAYIPLGSPVLQRKQGYKNVLEAWNRFNSALKLSWNEADMQFFGGQKNVALLYEYWCFLQTFDVFCDLATISEDSLKELLEPTADGFTFNLKKGKTSAVWGILNGPNGQLNAKLTYQPHFRPSLDNSANSTWSKNMQPDMTLSFFPSTFPANDAREASAADWDELRYYHLDAKYKIRLPSTPVTERVYDEHSSYKFDDIDKMHAYNDAINHSIGAVILYPGATSQIFNHPSGKGQVGAVAMSPAASQAGKLELLSFLKDALSRSFTSGGE